MLSSAALDVPPPELRRSVARQLGLSLGAAGTITAASSTAKALGGGLWLKWLGVGLAVGVAAGAGASYLGSPTSVVAPTSLPSLAPMLPSPSTPSALARREPAPGPSADSSSAPAAMTIPDKGRAAAHPTASALAVVSAEPVSAPLVTGSFPPAAQSELAAELAALSSVRASLAAQDPGAALRGIDQYERAYPNGLVRLEAEVLRIDAYAALGNGARARQLGERFLSAHPDSPYARHVRALLGSDATKP